MNPRCPECGLYELNDGSEETLWTCECDTLPYYLCPKCNLADHSKAAHTYCPAGTPATPTAPGGPHDRKGNYCCQYGNFGDGHTCAKRSDEPTAPEADVHSCYEGHCTPTYAELRDAAAEKDFNDNCDVHSEDADTHFKGFKAGADWGYAFAKGEIELESLKDVEWIGKWQNEANRLGAELTERRKEMDANFYKVEKLTAELAAYKKAKAENDERFQLEVGRLRALTEADKLEIDGLREENASYRARLEKAEGKLAEWPNNVLQNTLNQAVVERDRALKALERALSIGEFSATERAEIERVLKQGAQNE